MKNNLISVNSEISVDVAERLPTYNDVLELIVMNKIQRGDFDDLAEQMIGSECEYLCDEDCDYSSDGECCQVRASERLADGESKRLLSAGYTDCMDEAIRFLVEEEKISPEHPVVRNLRAHLEESRERMLETVAEVDVLATRIQRSVDVSPYRECLVEAQCAWNAG